MERNMLFRELQIFSAPIERELPTASFSKTEKKAMLQRLSDVVKTELTLWEYGIKKEGHKNMYDHVKRYWIEGIGISDSSVTTMIEQRKDDISKGREVIRHPWSAAFISYIMRKAYPEFHKSTAHNRYVIWAKENRLQNRAHPFQAFRIGEVTIEIGDIICNARGKKFRATYDNMEGMPETHGDVVIAINGNKATVIGGNVNRNVETKTVVLTINGKVQQKTVNGHPHYVAVIKMMPASPVIQVETVPTQVNEQSATSTAISTFNEELIKRLITIAPISAFNYHRIYINLLSIINKGGNPDKITDVLFYAIHGNAPNPLTKGHQLVPEWMKVKSKVKEVLSNTTKQTNHYPSSSLTQGQPTTSSLWPSLDTLPSISQQGIGWLVGNVASTGTTDWSKVNIKDRRRYVMNVLIKKYNFPPNGAVGIVGNLESESFIIPNCIEGASEKRPMRCKGFQEIERDFTPDEVMNRDKNKGIGPKLGGIGLAQWTYPSRRKGLFSHVYNGKSGASILFDMDAQIDYLVTELKRDFKPVYSALMNNGTTVQRASDIFLSGFEKPESIWYVEKGESKRLIRRSNNADIPQKNIDNALITYNRRAKQSQKILDEYNGVSV